MKLANDAIETKGSKSNNWITWGQKLHVNLKIQINKTTFYVGKEKKQKEDRFKNNYFKMIKKLHMW